MEKKRSLDVPGLIDLVAAEQQRTNGGASIGSPRDIQTKIFEITQDGKIFEITQDVTLS